MRERDITLQLALTVTAFWIALSCDGGGGGVFALNCVTCTNHDFSDSCYNLYDREDDKYVIETCNDETDELTPVCKKVLRMECQAFVFGDNKDMVGQGKGEVKRWKWMGCDYVDVNQDQYKNHGDCYWERFRSGRDILHKVSGFKVLARSSIEITCYCTENECNRDTDYSSTTIEVDKCTCGPHCNQASRNECESPDFTPTDDVPEEPFAKNCECERIEVDEKTEPTERKYPDCGQDPDLWEPEKVGSGTYRHLGGVDSSPGAAVRRGGGWAAGAAAAAVCWNLGGWKLGRGGGGG